MHKKLSWILIGGLGWGIPFALTISIIRWIENKPVAFGSFAITLIISVIAGIIWGLHMCNKHKDQSLLQNIGVNYLKNIVGVAVALLLYALGFKYILTPYQLNNSLWSSALLVGLFFIVIWLQQKYWINQQNHPQSQEK